MDLKTALQRFTNVHQELKPKPKKVISKPKPIKPVYEYKFYPTAKTKVSTRAVLACSKGYDFQEGI